VRKDFFASYFWADILSDIINVKKQEVIDVSSVNNKFRRIIGTSWGYMDGDSQSVNSDVKNLKLVVENKIPSVFFEQISKELTNLVMKKFLKRIWQFVYENPRKFLKKRKFFGLYKTKTLSS
jgi:ribosome-associated toxin RatA of RatAB toxin-antitoxin module